MMTIQKGVFTTGKGKTKLWKEAGGKKKGICLSARVTLCMNQTVCGCAHESVRVSVFQ
jgi:hypothetical protein